MALNRINSRAKRAQSETNLVEISGHSHRPSEPHPKETGCSVCWGAWLRRELQMDLTFLKIYKRGSKMGAEPWEGEAWYNPAQGRYHWVMGVRMAVHS